MEPALMDAELRAQGARLPIKAICLSEEMAELDLGDARLNRRAIYVVATHEPPPDTPPTLGEIVRVVAGFGGFLDRNGDGMPGPRTFWIGLQRCKDFVLAIEAKNLAQRGDCG